VDFWTTESSKFHVLAPLASDLLSATITETITVTETEKTQLK